MSKGPWKKGCISGSLEYFAQKQRDWRNANRPRARAVAAARIQPIRELIKAMKKRPCMDCGVEYASYVMQYDHRDPATKCFTISAAPGKYTADEVLDEIAKCDVVCANCHAERTFGKQR